MEDQAKTPTVDRPPKTWTVPDFLLRLDLPPCPQSIKDLPPIVPPAPKPPSREQVEAEVQRKHQDRFEEYVNAMEAAGNVGTPKKRESDGGSHEDVRDYAKEKPELPNYMSLPKIMSTKRSAEAQANESEDLILLPLLRMRETFP